MMSDHKKINSKEKEKKLIEKIEKAKKDLLHLQKKRKEEIGHLAYKHGLDHLDNQTLEQAFANLAQEFAHDNT